MSDATAAFFREKDINDLVFMLTATLQLGPIPVTDVQDSDPDLSDRTNSSNDSDRTIVENGYNHSSSPERSTICL